MRTFRWGMRSECQLPPSRLPTLRLGSFGTRGFQLWPELRRFRAIAVQVSPSDQGLLGLSPQAMEACGHSCFFHLGRSLPHRSKSSASSRSATLLGFLHPIIDIRDPIEVLDNRLARWARFKSCASPKWAPCPVSQGQFVFVAFRTVLFAEYHLYFGLISCF